MNFCLWRCPSLARLGGAGLNAGIGRRGWGGAPLRLTYRLTGRPAPPQRGNVVYTTLRQSVTHYHAVTHRHIHRHVSPPQLHHTSALVLLLSPAQVPRPAPALDPSRPTRSAQTLLRIFSMESARRQLQPFYGEVVRRVLRQEQERYQSKPAQAISLIWTLFGRQRAFRTLTRFYLGAVEKLGAHYYPALTGSNALYLAAGVVLHSKVYQRYVRQIWSHEREIVPLRYAAHEQAVTDDLLRLPTARQAPLARRAVEQAVGGEEERQKPPGTEPPQPARLSEADFRALVRGVANSLGRQTRLETLRRGGV